MSLRVWLPLTDGTLKQQGLESAVATTGGTVNLTNAGKLGKCATIGTTAGGITLPASTMQSFTECSVAFWIKIISWNTSYATFFQAGLGSTPWNNYIFGILRNNQNSNLCFTLTNSGGSSTSASYVTSNLNLNQWYHLAFTYKAGVVCTYIDGALDKTYNTSYVPNFAGITHISIGRSTNNSNYQTNCSLNDFRIYDHCLSPMEVKELAKGLVLHYPLNRNGWGQENLATQYVVPGSNGPLVTTTAGRTVYYGKYGITIPTTENADTYFSIYMKQALESGKKYTLSCEVNGLSNGTYYNFPLFAQNNSSMGLLKLDHNGLCSLTFTMNYTGTVATSTVDGVTLYRLFMDDISRSIASGQGAITVTNIKLEEGDKVTPWCPASIDSSYTTMGLNGTTEYDCSGFCNNGTKNNITYTSDTPKYAVSSIFNGSNSYIKVNDNNWMIKGMSEMTVNLWAKATTWPTNGGRLVSCTESGGFNLEAGSSGYWRFPIYVYTNSGQTSSAYKYDSNEIKIADLVPNEWNMITLVYDSTGTKTYLNGELHHTYTNTSYGINFNTNARLFLGCEANTASPYTPYFNGKECDFRIYATALSADDVQSLYQNSAYIDSSGNVYGAVHSEV